MGSPPPTGRIRDALAYVGDRGKRFGRLRLWRKMSSRVRVRGVLARSVVMVKLIGLEVLMRGCVRAPAGMPAGLPAVRGRLGHHRSRVSREVSALLLSGVLSTWRTPLASRELSTRAAVDG